MEISVFDIPLIIHGVTQYLSRNDLTNCALASKDWYSWFNPVLWHSPNFNQDFSITSEQLTALSRNEPYVRSLHGYILGPGPGNNPITFSNLQSFEFNFNYRHHVDMEISTLISIELTPTLQNLTLTLSLHKDKVLERLVHMLESHPRLQRFDLTCNELIDSVAVQQIIEASCYLDSLGLHFWCGTPEQSRHNSIEQYTRCGIAAKAMEEMQDTTIRELSFQFSLACEESSILVPLLDRCPLLEKLSVEAIHYTSTLREIESIFRDNRCPRIQVVNLGFQGHHYNIEKFIPSLIACFGCFGDQEHDRCDGGDDSLRSSSEDPLESRGLKSLTIHYSIAFTDSCAQALIRHHAYTLTRLELHKRIEIRLLESLLGHLPNLLSLTVSADLKHSTLQGEMRNYRMSRKKWICLRLIQMDLSINMRYNIGGVEASEWKSSLEDDCMNHVFTQIGRLTNLEEWSLGSNLDLLTLKGNQYLCKLTELKRLKMLHLKQAYSPYLMASEEADWIIENWPRLVHLVIDNRETSRMAYESDIFATETFTKTLAKKRPWIRID